MALETATYISDLVATNPTGTDPKSQGDDQIRLVKSTIKTTFPNVSGAVTMTHAELNTVTSRALRAGDTYTGAHDFTGGTLTAPTRSVGDASANVATTSFVASVALSTALPGQTGSDGKFIRTDGTNPTWSHIYGPVTAVSLPTNAIAGGLYAFLASTTLTLPSAPAAGDVVHISNQSGVATCVVGRNGAKIMSLSEDMTVTELNASFSLVYVDSTRGWVIF